MRKGLIFLRLRILRSHKKSGRAAVKQLPRVSPKIQGLLRGWLLSVHHGSTVLVSQNHYSKYIVLWKESQAFFTQKYFLFFAIKMIIWRIYMYMKNSLIRRRFSQEGQNAAERLAINIAANEVFIQLHYSGEEFISTTAQLQATNRYTKKIVLPENVKIAQSRVIIKSNEQQRILRKELRQAGILSRMGNSVYLTPEYSTYKVRVTDAVVNGVPFEFRTVTGTVKKIEKRFGEAKEKGIAVNVYLHLASNAAINEARRRIGLVLERHPEYSGKIIVSTKDGKVHFWESGSFWK